MRREVRDPALALLSLTEVARLLKRRTVSPVEVTRAVLDRIAAVNERLNAFLTITADDALAAARRAERAIRAGRYRGPLHGVPVSVKDLIPAAGTRTTCGSRILADWIPDTDATLIRRLREAGAILIGKTHLHEFAYGPTNVNPHYGAARNPWDPQRMTGGSSGGSGSAVATGCSYVSIGTDTGGSVRIPAALCGVVGLKPTYGRISRAGIFPLSWSNDHAGPLTRTVADAALALQALSGFDAADPGSSRHPLPNFSRGLTAGVKGLRLGVPREFFWDNVDPEVAEAVKKAIAVLAGLGAAVRQVSWPMAVEAKAISFLIMGAESYSVHERWLKARPEDYGPDVRQRLAQGATILAGDYLRAQRLRRGLIQTLDAVLATCDVLLTPTVPVAAPRLDETTLKWPKEAESMTAALPRLTRAFNLTGTPALSVPCGLTTQGLPIGLQIAGRAFDEATVLRVGHAYEQAARIPVRRPREP
jgi:aspartyl-tRNA(Asn)/glutamyl-tRNA(Gln) amidotransferase subunit A